MTRIGFIRHGITQWNIEGRAQGQRDVPLSAEGIRQARLLAQRMAGEEWDFIYSSDLSRANRTAQYVAEAMGKTVFRVDSRIREKSHGRLDGTTEEERIKLWGEDWRQLDHQEESREEVLKRSLEVLGELCREHKDKRILIVSHGAWIRTTLSHLLPQTEIGSLHNTSLSVLQKIEGGWKPLLINCKKHLD